MFIFASFTSPIAHFIFNHTCCASDNPRSGLVPSAIRMYALMAFAHSDASLMAKVWRLLVDVLGGSLLTRRRLCGLTA